VSVRSFVRLGSGVSLQDVFYFQGSDASTPTYIKYSSDTLQVVVKDVKVMTIEEDGGQLHGSWNAETAIYTSDRRLKKDIQPLQRTLRGAISAAGLQPKEPPRFLEKGRKSTESQAPKSAPLPGAAGAAGGDGALWLLRQLRPVSYSFRKGAESKYMRFGFIADELESVVPQVVRGIGDKEVKDQKAVVYQDLIALLAAALQSLQTSFNSLSDEIQSMKRAKMARIQQEEKMKAERRAREAERKAKKKQRKRAQKERSTSVRLTQQAQKTGR
jgi:hypothetical protein